MCIITQVGPDMRAVGRVAGNMARYIYIGGGLAMRVEACPEICPGEIMYIKFYGCICIYLHASAILQQ